MGEHARLGLNHLCGPHDRKREAVGPEACGAQDLKVRVAEGHVEREAHSDRVDRAGSLYEQRPLEPVEAEKAPMPVVAV